MPAIWSELEALWPARVDLGLERVRRAAALLGLGSALQRRQWILVAGTNGKGSTSAAIAAILSAHGYRVGLYTSPHLAHPRERISLDGLPISDASAEKYLRPALELVAQGEKLTYFEAMTLGAIAYFAGHSADWGVLEVGLGGRLDATNIVSPAAAVITSVGLDHTQWLGRSIRQIAWEKGGICRHGVPLITALSSGDLAWALARRQPPSSIVQLDQDFHGRWLSPRILEVRLPSGRALRAEPRLVGVHQAANLATAAACVETVLGEQLVRLEALRHGLQSVAVPARLQSYVHHGTRWLVDGAHNPAGANALAASLELLGESPRLGVVAIRRDKDASLCLGAYASRCRMWLPTTGRASHTYWTPSELAAVIRRLGCRVVGGDLPVALDDTLRTAESICSDGQTCLVTGSLYFAGDVLASQGRLSR